MSALTISFDRITISDCACALIVPENGADEPGYIKGLSVQGGANEKHEFHALAQTAYYQYQDNELDLTTMLTPAVITYRGDSIELPSGLVVYRHRDSIRVVVHEGMNSKKLLEAAYRFCTRWVRLDI